MFKKLAIAVNVVITALIICVGVVAYANDVRNLSLEADLLSQLNNLKTNKRSKTIQKVYKPLSVEVNEFTANYDHIKVNLADTRKVTAENIEDFPQVFCLAQNIYFEAGIESVAGKAAVARVTINRVKSPKFPDTICDVVWQRKQFSWTHDGKSDRIPSNGKATWEQSIAVAYDAYYVGKWDGLVEGATHYHADYVNPVWAKKIRRITKIDTHIFYE